MNIYDLGKEPISGDNAAGVDVSYSDDYEALVEEVKKLSSPTADSAIDWSKVAELSQKILEQESKNILVTAFLGIALGHTQGLKGCALGIHVLRDLLYTFWDTLYPPKKRKKGRINALVWWNDCLKDLLEALEPETWEASQREETFKELQEIDDFISEHLPDGPLLRPLMESLSSRLLLPATSNDDQLAPDTTPETSTSEMTVIDSQEPTPQPQPTLQKVSASPHGQAVTAPVVPATTSLETDDADDFFRAGFDYLCSSATKLFAKDYTNPVSYQINRLAAWSQVDQLPSVSHQETMLTPPNEQILSLLQQQYQAKHWHELLTTAEGNVRQYLFWLDLSYWVATALEQLGATMAALAVKNDTSLYANRLHPIETFCFQGGLPFAGDATKAWLLPGSESDGMADEPVVVSGKSDDTFEKCLAKAGELASGAGISKALQYFQANVGAITTKKDRFLSDLSLCQILLTGQKVELAVPFAERMLTVIDAQGLEEWEPELAVKGLSVVHLCFRQCNGEEWSVRSGLIQNRLTLLAPEKIINKF